MQTFTAREDHMIFLIGKHVDLYKLTMCNISPYYDVCHFNRVISNYLLLQLIISASQNIYIYVPYFSH